jgi:phage I-like protein
MAIATRQRPTRRTADVPIAACVFEIVAAQSAGDEVQLFPNGHFCGVDGRPANAADWVMNAGIAARLIAHIGARANPLVIDYEHQTLNAEDNDQPTPVAGSFKQLHYRPGQGLYAVGVE